MYSTVPTLFATHGPRLAMHAFIALPFFIELERESQESSESIPIYNCNITCIVYYNCYFCHITHVHIEVTQSNSLQNDKDI